MRKFLILVFAVVILASALLSKAFAYQESFLGKVNSFKMYSEDAGTYDTIFNIEGAHFAVEIVVVSEQPENVLPSLPSQNELPQIRCNVLSLITIVPADSYFVQVLISCYETQKTYHFLVEPIDTYDNTCWGRLLGITVPLDQNNLTVSNEQIMTEVIQAKTLVQDNHQKQMEKLDEVAGCVYDQDQRLDGKIEDIRSRVDKTKTAIGIINSIVVDSRQKLNNLGIPKINKIFLTRKRSRH